MSEFPEVDQDHAAELANHTSKDSGDYVPDPGELMPKAEPEQPEMSTAELCQMVVGVLFAIVANRRGEHWNLSPEETEKLGNAAGAVVDKYAPDLDTGPEAALVMVGVMIAAPRLAMDKQIEAEKEENGKEAVTVDGQEPGHNATE